MLFRSGYAKRHLILRLKDAPLGARDCARIEALLKRAITDGTGLEEFCAYSKLAARMVSGGLLPDFADWLRGQAEGVLFEGRELRDLRRGKPQSTRMLERFLHDRSTLFRGPSFDTMARAEEFDRRQQMPRRNAYRMLASVEQALKSAFP